SSSSREKIVPKTTPAAVRFMEGSDPAPGPAPGRLLVLEASLLDVLLLLGVRRLPARQRRRPLRPGRQPHLLLQRRQPTVHVVARLQLLALGLQRVARQALRHLRRGLSLPLRLLDLLRDPLERVE